MVAANNGSVVARRQDRGKYTAIFGWEEWWAHEGELPTTDFGGNRQEMVAAARVAGAAASTSLQTSWKDQVWQRGQK